MHAYSNLSVKHNTHTCTHTRTHTHTHTHTHTQNETATVEEFHQELQSVVNFPVKDFIIPFLKVGKMLHICCWYGFLGGSCQCSPPAIRKGCVSAKPFDITKIFTNLD